MLKRVESLEALKVIDEVAAQRSVHQATALGLRARHTVRKGDTKTARGLLEGILRAYPDSEAAFLAHLALFHLYLTQAQYAQAEGVLAGLRPEDDSQARSLALAYKLLALTTETAYQAPSPHAAETDPGAPSRSETTPTLAVTAYPNPFNPVTTIRYTLPAESRVILQVYDMLGRAVMPLVDAVQGAGMHEVAFDATHLASGLYQYRLEVDGQVQTGTMLLFK